LKVSVQSHLSIRGIVVSNVQRLRFSQQQDEYASTPTEALLARG
jgi:hypothetical protein